MKTYYVNYQIQNDSNAQYLQLRVVYVNTDKHIKIDSSGRQLLDHIFEPFEREQNTTFSGVYGTGLRLTIAKNIVKMMGGTITAESTVGIGSTFTVPLRLRTQSNPLMLSMTSVCL